MKLAELLEGAPPNLSARAFRDYVAILQDSGRRFGPQIARRSRDRLNRRMADIEAGRVLGHRRSDVPSQSTYRFVNETPWIISFDPDTRVVLRILHEKRDLPTLLP